MKTEKLVSAWFKLFAISSVSIVLLLTGCQILHW